MHTDKIEKFLEKQKPALASGGQDRILAQHEKGKLTARERIHLLLDEGSFTEIDALVTHHYYEYDMQKKVVSAFIYPVVIMSITILMALGIVLFIMPKIIRIFSTFKIDLPLPTKILIGFSELLTKQTIWVILATVAAVQRAGGQPLACREAAVGRPG